MHERLSTVVGRWKPWENTPLCEDEHTGMEEWRRVVGEWMLSLPPCDVRRKNPLVQWASGQGLTVLPQPPPLSNNYLNHPQQDNKEVGWDKEDGKSTRWQHMGFSPKDQGLTSPTPYPLEPFPFHSTLHCRSWLWFILIDVHVYMMPNYNVPYSTTYHRQLSPLPKPTQPNRWWGFWLELLTTINYNIYIMQTGSKPGTWQ